MVRLLIVRVLGTLFKQFFVCLFFVGRRITILFFSRRLTCYFRKKSQTANAFRIIRTRNERREQRTNERRGGYDIFAKTLSRIAFTLKKQYARTSKRVKDEIFSDHSKFNFVINTSFDRKT